MKMIKEGRAKISVPEVSVRRNAYVFYNPEMSYARDVSVSFISWLSSHLGKKLVVLDPMAATGIRGIRFLLETDAVEKVVFNDINPEAASLIRHNLELNKISRKMYEIENKDCNMLFLERRKEFDYIDIDPFGSPVSYLPNVWHALKKRGALAVSATDTGALSGSFKSTCRQRYGIIAEKVDFFKEFGICALIATVQRDLARHDISFSPVITHTKHYFRVIGLVKKSAEAAKKSVEMINFVTYCPSCFQKDEGISERCKNCGKRAKVIGPLWIGKTKEGKICSSLLEIMRKMGFKKTKELEICSLEIDEPFYYDAHKICKNIGISAPPLSDIFSELKNLIFSASRTHLAGTGFKTSAMVSDIEDAIRRLKEHSISN